MLTILLVATLLYQVLLTIGSIIVWKQVKKNNATQLPKVFFAITTVRLATSVMLFALALWYLQEDTKNIKIFSSIFLAIYTLLLIIDTAYFYCSSIKIKK